VTMDLDVKILPEEIIEILRERLVELEHLEATGAATPDICEMLVAVRGLLAKLEKLPEHAGETLH
jgi:hypothetical protein